MNFPALRRYVPHDAGHGIRFRVIRRRGNRSAGQGCDLRPKVGRAGEAWNEGTVSFMRRGASCCRRLFGLSPERKHRRDLLAPAARAEVARRMFGDQREPVARQEGAAWIADIDLATGRDAPVEKTRTARRATRRS